MICYVVMVANQMASASILSLPLPLMSFLWGTLSVPRPTETFWITIITYTEVIIIVKYIFQFNFISWNNQNFSSAISPPNIIGIEKTDYYAKYDLAVLFVVFFHTIILKSLGLWKDRISIGNGSLPKDDSKMYISKEEKEVSGSNRNNMNVSVQSNDDKIGKTSGHKLSKQKSYFDGMCHYLEPFKEFFNNLFSTQQLTVDVYVYMFFCDFINFFIIAFGYWAFGAGTDEGLTSYFQENNVPTSFLIMLLTQFGLIIIDRALYLRKCILGKLIFQIFTVFIVHLWMFFILPAVTFRQFTTKEFNPPMLWYFVKCIYLLLSAFQLRSGYPTRILTNCFCKHYNYINVILFKGYLLIPFLYDIRTMMDWMWTDTSLNLTNWLKLEDIYSNTFILKCWRRAEDDYPVPRGIKYASTKKYGIGGSLVMLIIFIIWFPLLLFALRNTVGDPNIPYECTLELAISEYEPIFKKEPSAMTFLTNYHAKDTALISLSGNSASFWTISSPSQDALIKELKSDNVLKMKLSLAFFRTVNKYSDSEKIVTNEYEIPLINKTARNLIASVLKGEENKTSIVIDKIFPKYLRVLVKGNVIPVKEFAKFDPTENISLNEKLYSRSLLISLKSGNFNNLTSRTQWWEVQEYCNKSNFPFSFLRVDDCKYLRILIFNDRVFPSKFYLISRYGIIGLYTTFVMLVSHMIRSNFVAGSSYFIMFQDMPYVDRILKLCLDIYLVRESGEFSLEEDLFAELLFLYRSPESIVKWTKYPD
ncbi:piezo-type mechanosensitive ion channel component 1-like isoform X2 [Centruroides sculpturatus]|uniref:piezo-type mechanosensitive ion channel component 1-like isoform X2 n=1 Tax=Centruroides sculpturatus TaxID=218467 RepID=UPI000C6E4BA8|nr:piezo-type mechanosensitive ion channel component 1-like isoform X2 [Centruroides sculpturatus]